MLMSVLALVSAHRGKTYDTVGGAETPDIMRGYCRAATLLSQ